MGLGGGGDLYSLRKEETSKGRWGGGGFKYAMTSIN